MILVNSNLKKIKSKKSIERIAFFGRFNDAAKFYISIYDFIAENL